MSSLAQQMVQHCVLIVDDNRVHREVASMALQRHGMKVVQARDGEEALARLQRNDFALILMDVEMPWMNGIKTAELIRVMKARGELPDIPIIAFTADHSPATQERCLAAGMIDVIVKDVWKPHWEKLILARLEKWIT